MCDVGHVLSTTSYVKVRQALPTYNVSLYQVHSRTPTFQAVLNPFLNAMPFLV